ncbi:MAG: NrfD/PsrC family molybdoenzyme membrane anchor subunit [Thermodesulfobacteriota bacterium]
MNEKWYKIIIGVCLAGLVVGSWGMFQRLAYGHLPMNYGSFVPWGLWVAFDLFFLGLTAGAFLITILTYVFRIKLLADLGPLAVFTVLVTLMAEFLIIILDLGHPLRVYRFLISPNLGSMLFWLVVFITSMWIIYVPWLYFLLREQLVLYSQDPKRPGQDFYRFLTFGKTTYTEEDRRRDHQRSRFLSFLSLPIGIIFFGAHGAIFAILHNRPIWNSAMLPLIFIMAALLSGGALITFLAYLFQPNDELIHPLGHVVLMILLSFLFLEALQFFVGYQSKITNIVTSLDLIAFGPFWWAFWIVHLLVGSIIPAFLLIRYPENSKMVAWACFLIIVTFLAVRLNYLFPDLAVYKLEGLQNTFFHSRLRTDYVPNLNEWLVSVWVTSLGLLIFMLGTRWLPVIAAGRGEKEHV